MKTEIKTPQNLNDFAVMRLDTIIGLSAVLKALRLVDLKKILSDSESKLYVQSDILKYQNQIRSLINSLPAENLIFQYDDFGANKTTIYIDSENYEIITY